MFSRNATARCITSVLSSAVHRSATPAAQPNQRFAIFPSHSVQSAHTNRRGFWNTAAVFFRCVLSGRFSILPLAKSREYQLRRFAFETELHRAETNAPMKHCAIRQVLPNG